MIEWCFSFVNILPANNKSVCSTIIHLRTKKLYYNCGWLKESMACYGLKLGSIDDAKIKRTHTFKFIIIWIKSCIETVPCQATSTLVQVQPTKKKHADNLIIIINVLLKMSRMTTTRSEVRLNIRALPNTVGVLTHLGQIGEWLIGWSWTSREQTTDYMRRPCKGHAVGCLWNLLPKPSTEGD